VVDAILNILANSICRMHIHGYAHPLHIWRGKSNGYSTGHRVLLWETWKPCINGYLKFTIKFMKAMHEGNFSMS